MIKTEYKTSILVGIGGMLEYYDFFLYALFAPEISKIFFSPIESDFIRNLIMIGIFSVAYIVRPLGAFVCGWFGDKYGRKKTFSITIITMALAAFFMSTMPSYMQIGILAPVLFVLLRVIQGLAIGGEVGGAISFIYENNTKIAGTSLGLIYGFVFAGYTFGYIIHGLFPAVFGNDYAWRAAFLLGSFVAFFGFYIRQKLEETPMFLALENKEKVPALALIQKHFKTTIFGVLCVLPVAFNGVIVSLYLPHYLGHYFSYGHKDLSDYFIIFSILNFLSIFIASHVSQRIGIFKLYKTLVTFLLILSLPLFFAMKLGFTFMIIAMMILVIMIGAISGLFAIMLCVSFPTKIRYSGVAVSYNLSFAIVGSSLPVIIETISAMGYHILAPSISIILCLALGLIGAIGLKKGVDTQKAI